MFNPLSLLESRKEVALDFTEADLRPMSELDHFQSKTRLMIDGLDAKITDLDAEISFKIAQLNDLRKIRSAQQLALNFMEDKT